MDYGKILARAFEITRRYRALWLFGILLALFGGQGGSVNFSFPGGGGGSGRGGGEGTVVPTPTLPENIEQIILTLVIAIACFALVWIVLSIILRFVSRAALIGLVQELEADGTVPKVGRGFSIGSNRFWSLLGIALVINIPLTLLSLAVMLVAMLPLIGSLLPLISAGRRPPSEVIGVALAGIFGSIALLCCALLILWLIQLVVNPFYEFIVRTCVIGKRGVMDSIREGYRIVRANLGNVAVLYILIIAIGLGFGLLMIPVALILIGIPAGVGFVVGVAANAVTPGIVAGVILGIPMLLILIFIGGLFQTFLSTVWTEGYLAVTAPRAQTPAPATVTT